MIKLPPFATTAAALFRTWSIAFAPLPDEPVHRWAERTTRLTQYTENKGEYSTLLTPFVREWLECFRDPSVVETTLVTGSQVAKTQTELIGLAWSIKHRPTESLWVGANREDVKSLAETRWNDIIDHNPELVALKPSDSDKYKKTEQQFAQCTVHWAGSNSPGKLASKPIGLLILDETDKYRQASTREAHAGELAEQRVKSYSSYKIFRSSTPTTRDGYIWQKYEQGDMRRYFVPCPHCRELITLEWKQIKWEETARTKDGWDLDRVAASGYYECQHCSGRIEERHKTAMLRAGVWRPTNPRALAGHRSYHLSSLYSPWRLTSFGALAAQFLEAKESLLGLQGFISGALAEPWEQQQYVDPIAFPAGEYSMADVFAEERACLITVDVQHDDLWVEARGHGDGMRSRLHFAGRMQSFADVEALHHRFGSQANSVGVDCGYDRNGDVYKICARNQWFALRGDDPADGFYRHTLPSGVKIRRIYSPPEKIDAHIGTSGTGYCLRVFFAKSVVDDILQQLLLGVRGEWPTPRDVPREWLEQINARRKLPRRNPITGAITYEWVEVVRKWDHLRDTSCMQVVMAAMRGYLRELDSAPETKANTAPLTAEEIEKKLAETVDATQLGKTPKTFPPPPPGRQPFMPRGLRRGFVKGW